MCRCDGQSDDVSLHGVQKLYQLYRKGQMNFVCWCDGRRDGVSLHCVQCWNSVVELERWVVSFGRLYRMEDGFDA